MKAKLIFNLPEEQDEFKLSIDGNKWFSVCFELNNKLRDALKYGHSYKDANEALEAIQDDLLELMNCWDISLDDVE